MNKNIFFYHGFRKSSDVLIEKAKIPASCKGKGAGGQSDGFYVWNNIEKAKEYLSGYICDNPVICKIKTNADNFEYPQWQFDYEALGFLQEPEYEEQKNIRKKLALLFVKYKDKLPDSYKEDLKNNKENGFNLLCVNETRYGSVRIMIETNKSTYRTALYEGFLAVSGCEQILNDYMCKHSKGYLAEYNDLMQECLPYHNLAFKYVGDKDLEVVDVYDGKGNKSMDLTKQFLPEKYQSQLLNSFALNKHNIR